MKRKHDEEEEDSEVEDPGVQDGQEAPVESDDEVEYYRQAVGQDPDEGEYESKMPFTLTVGVGLSAINFFVQTCFPPPRRGKARLLVEQQEKKELANLRNKLLQEERNPGTTLGKDGRPETGITRIRRKQ